MQTFGFTCGYSGPVVLDQLFSEAFSDFPFPICSSYIFLPATATPGGIVFLNPAGVLSYYPYAMLGYNPIAAKKILTSATVNGTPRSTTATPMAWAGGVYS